MKNEKNKDAALTWLTVIAPACAAIALSSLSSGMSQGPLAFAAGFGIGACAVTACLGIVAAVKRQQAGR